eukprot:CAMPEP_0179490930 /NCGR_PEP_ID=MMETSP0799-20121207/65773_1 /TAXON_ID=46947 /ORGANISM="Geminigera cryophila, Strain CCMP2564" /LENGTH=42 /DNA_ID= /DNA_START= /DNA_END= /DNA_ORIENTATION=
MLVHLESGGNSMPHRGLQTLPHFLPQPFHESQEQCVQGARQV